MEMKKLFAFLMLLLTVLAASRVTEARECESKSRHYKGFCRHSHNCAMVCKTEGFTGGHCRGFRHRCFCTRGC
ncbi:hypothetical protein Ancab_023959 [Ancistrocladus abbreviatus]